MVIHQPQYRDLFLRQFKIRKGLCEMTIAGPMRQPDVKPDNGIQFTNIVILWQFSCRCFGHAPILSPGTLVQLLVEHTIPSKTREDSTMAHFPDSPNSTGFNTPNRIEANIADLIHEGEIEGVFFWGPA